MRGLMRSAPLLLALAGTMASGLRAQQAHPDAPDGGPRFLLAAAGASAPVRIEPSRVPMLSERLTVRLEHATLDHALQTISGLAGIRLVYSGDVVPLHKRVSLKAEEISVAAALTEVLLGASVDVVISGNNAALVRRAPDPLPGTITGRVTNAETDEPVVNAQVAVDGRGRALTDSDGRYRIDGVELGMRTVSVTSIGYASASREVDVGDGATVTLDFALEVAPTALTELVVTATGEQRRLELGQVVGRVDADSLASTAPVMSFNDLLLGRSPGVLSMVEGGGVGGAGRIRIRGLNSALLSNDPIVIVDGVRVESSAAGGRGPGDELATGGQVTGRLADLDPDEIASVEVVKGPSAATLYGTDAANGVLVITTKRGQAGRTRWTVFMDQGLLQQKLDLEDLYPDTYYAFGRSTTTDEPLRCTLLLHAEGGCVADSLSVFNPFKHPELTPFKNGYRSQYGLQVSGGTAGGSTFFLSGAIEQEVGSAHMPEVDQALVKAQRGVAELPEWQVRPNAFRRVNLRGNFTTPVARRGTITLSTGFVANRARVNDNYAYENVGYRDDNDGWVRYGPADNRRPGYRFSDRKQDEVRRFTSSLALTYDLLEGLALRATAGADLSANSGGYLLRTGDRGPGSNTSLRIAEDYQLTLYTLDVGATATRRLSAALSSRTSAGVQYNRRTSHGRYTSAEDLPLGGETIEGAGFTHDNRERTNATAVVGAYVEEQLALRDRVFLTGALRFDGASAFGQDFSVATYPKVGVSWVVTDGDVGSRLGPINTLRLRAAYGASGVQPGPTDALSRVEVATGISLEGPTTVSGGSLVEGNPDLRPERSTEIEGGLDLELAAGRLRLELTGYRRTSTDALVSRPNAPSVGGSRIENLGSVRNEGLELLLSADMLRGGALAAGFTATGSLNRNRLLELSEGVTVRNPLSESAQQEEGYPLYGLWGFVIESLADANGNGVIEPGDFVLSPETRFLGSSFPTREATLSPYISLFGERLRLSGLAQYRGGFHRFSFQKAYSCLDPAASCRAVNDPTTPLEEQARSLAFRTRFLTGPLVEDASYLMLRELSATLTVPPSLARLAGADAASVLLAGRNLAMLWKASDVPIENAVSNLESQVDAGLGPAGPLTTWLLRVQLNY